MPVTITIIDDAIEEDNEGFYLFISNYTSLNHSESNSANASDDIHYMNRVTHVVIYDLDFPGMIVSCDSSNIGRHK